MDDDEIPVIDRTEVVEGTVQCHHCDYWGSMKGYIDSDDNQFISFVCPECSTREKVRNFDAQ